MLVGWKSGTAAGCSPVYHSASGGSVAVLTPSDGPVTGPARRMTEKSQDTLIPQAKINFMVDFFSPRALTTVAVVIIAATSWPTGIDDLVDKPASMFGVAA